LQLGRGFWVLALDSVAYYEFAADAARAGLASVSAASASPAYVRLLALALRVWGETPATAVLMNTVAYVIASAVCVAVWPRQGNRRSRFARAAAIIGLSFSPSLVFAATQPLKDQMFVLFFVVFVASGYIWLRWIGAPSLRPSAAAAVAFAGATVA